MVDFDHPVNRAILAYLGAPDRRQRSVSTAASRDECRVKDVSDPYTTLGTHPDLVARLWDELAADLPRDCRWVVFGTPALVRPDSGIVFGFAGGSQTYALRVPPDVRTAALTAGASTIHRYPAYPELGIEASVLDLGEFGDAWIFGGWFTPEHAWCAAADEFAAG